MGQKARIEKAFNEVETALKEMRLAGFDVIYGDKLPDWAHEGTVAGFRKKLDNGRFDVRWLFNFENYQGVTGWSTGDPIVEMELDACLERITGWLQGEEWETGDEEE